jgi:multicomponent Na+:H+ antiporter subunit D
MTPIPSWGPLLAVVVSLVAATLIAAIGERARNLRDGVVVLGAIAKAAVVCAMLPAVLAGRAPECRLFQIAPGIDLALRADPLGMVFALVASLLWVPTSIYAIGYVRGAGEEHQTRFFATFALCLAAAAGIAFAANLLTFFIFFEMLTFTTYPLVLHKETPEARAGAVTYLCYTVPAGLALLLAIAITWQVAGTLEFVPGGFLTRASAPSGLLVLAFVLFIVGVGVKAGIMPLHKWLPAAMVAPTPVSALLHAVAVVKAGVFGVLRITGFVFGPAVLRDLGLGTLLGWVAVTTFIVASLLALAEDNLKRRLAYSTVGHLSYIVLGAALLNAWGWAGAVLHLVFHATLKITLFFCAGAIYVRTHKERVSELTGIGRRMPLTMVAFAVGSLGLVGMPGVNGFLSKWALATGAADDHAWAMLAFLALSGVLNAAYFFPIVVHGFFESRDEHPAHGEASALLVAPLVATAVVSLILGVLPNAGIGGWHLAREVAAEVTGGPPS